MRVSLRPLLALLATSTVMAQEAPVDLSDPPRGSLQRVVSPEYPKQAMARGQTGIVWVEGNARIDGSVENVRYRPDKPESEVFVASLKEVARDWEFVPQYDNDCKPSPAPFAVEVSYEIDSAGQPHIYVEHRRANPDGANAAHFKAIRRVAPRYPAKALDRRMTANLFAKLVVDRSGQVADVKIHAYTWPVLPEGRTNPFVQPTEAALRKWEFPPVPEQSKAPWSGCYFVQFRITD